MASLDECGDLVRIVADEEQLGVGGAGEALGFHLTQPDGETIAVFLAREDHREYVDRLDLILDDTQGGTTAEGIHLGSTTRVVPLPTRPTPPPDR